MIPESKLGHSLRFSIHGLACVYLLAVVIADLRVCRDAYLVWSQRKPTRLSPRFWLAILVFLVFLVVAAPIIDAWLKLGHYLYLCLLALTYAGCLVGVTAMFLMPDNVGASINKSWVNLWRRPGLHLLGFAVISMSLRLIMNETYGMSRSTAVLVDWVAALD